jgi:hypothetical protein
MKKNNDINDGLELNFYLFLAISLAALMRGARVRRGSESLKKGC